MLHYLGWFECADDDQMSFSTLLHGETEEDIQTQLNEIIECERKESGMEYKVQINPMTTEEVIAEKENDLKIRIISVYLDSVTNPETTVKEYMKLRKNPDPYWKAIDYFMETIRAEKLVRDTANLDKLSVRLYNDYVNKLMNAKTMTEYQSIIDEIKKI